MSLAWLCLAMLCGCRFGFGDRAAHGDAADLDGAGDTDGAPAICHTGTFGAAQLIASTATLSEEASPSVSPDELTLYFSSNRSGGQMRAIWMATRASRADSFGAPTLVGELDSASDDDDPEIVDDGHTIYYSSNRVGGSGLIFYATRAGASGLFTEQGQLPISGYPFVMSNAPAVTADELTMYLGNSTDVAVASRPDRVSAFAYDRLITEVNAAPSDGNPTISADGLELLFDSYRTGPAAIFWALRAATTDPFPAPTQLTALDPGGFGAGTPELSADGRTLYYFVMDGASQLDLYAATRSCP